ncbi:MAG TPA: biotin/lipoyl-containing protein [Gemmataceae bacterium]|jgi:pyruvate/2-oxoglutarate dehydrogenase complex dihydrolipoamide acyltransferase (E2) component|nr:biotin/lipoyl-containing protein [Gemmataceae bacterium]
MPVILPDLGAGPVRVSVWFADIGDLVYEGDRLVEVMVKGATFDVSAPATGHLIEVTSFPNDLVDPGQTMGFVAQ